MTAEAISFPENFSTNVIDLGVQKRYFPASKRSRFGNLIGTILLMGAAVMAFLLSMVSTANDSLISLTIGAIVLFLLGLYTGWSAYSNWSKGVGVYERGFALRSREGFKVWHWTDIQSVTAHVTRHYTNGIYTGTTHQYTLLNKQNEKLKLNDVFQKVEELADIIQQNIYANLYNAAVDAYNAGSMVTFGPVNVDKAGLHIGKKDFAWSEIKQATLARGYLQVVPQKGGLFKNASIPASAIPNLPVLVSIINQLTGQAM